MGWIGCIHCEKTSWHELLYWLYQLGPFWIEFHKVMKCSQMHPNKSLASNVVDQVLSLWKIPTRIRSTNFCIDFTSSAHFEPSFVRWQNGAKCTQTRWNTPKHEFRVQWCGSDAFVAKIPTRLRGTNFCINRTSSARFEPSFIRRWNGPNGTQKIWNTPKHDFLGPMGWIGCVHCQKFRRDFLTQTFVLIAPVRTVLNRVS